MVIYFSYKLLSDKEIKNLKEKIKNGNGNDKNGENGNEEGKKEQIPKQEKINKVTFEEIKGILQNKKQYYLLKELIEKTKNEKPVLLYHINRFTAKNTRDFFIHKNLKRFLQEQLDYFIKAEVLDIETLKEEKYIDKHITRAKTVKEIGEKIIDFLSQIEDFQKRLWGKKKFVIKTDYVITLDRIKQWTDERFLDEVIEVVLRNEKQLKEWEELGFGKIEKKEDLIDKKLPIDTRYFDEEFKFKLLEKISERFDLDEILDGILIKSENWQALNLLLNKYRERVKSIYIDPPYNTGSDEFLYRDKYQHSSWLTMMENRLSLARELMKDDGVIFVSIDDNEVYYLKAIMDSIFRDNNFVANFIRRQNLAGKQDAKFIAIENDYIVCYSKNVNALSINRKPSNLEKYKYSDEFEKERGKFYLRKLDDEGIHYSEKLDYPIKIDKGMEILVFDDVSKRCIRKKTDESIEIWPGGDPADKRWTWRWSKDKVEWGIKNDLIVFKKNSKDKWQVYFKEYQYVDNNLNKIERSIPFGSLIMDFPNNLAYKGFKELFNNKKIYDYPKPINLIKHLLKIGSSKDSIILDFFAGSGTTVHAVMKLNKEDGGKRKFILIEIADYFYTAIIPRIKKVAYSFNWKDGKPQDTDGIGVFFKYHTLEQYEDALDNIERKENNKAQELFKDEYLLKYFLDFETIDSEYLLNIEKLKNPFAYKLKINEGAEPKEVVVDIPETFNYLLGVDIPETFNYLLGLKVKKVKVRYNEGKKYLFILGEKEGKDYIIIWREYQDGWTEEDFKKDKEFIKQELKEWKPQVVYISGQSILTQNFDGFHAEIRYIEPEFKRLMEG